MKLLGSISIHGGLLWLLHDNMKTETRPHGIRKIETYLAKFSTNFPRNLRDGEQVKPLYNRTECRTESLESNRDSKRGVLFLDRYQNITNTFGVEIIYSVDVVKILEP